MQLSRDERGLSTMEYIIIMVLIVIVGIVTWQVFGSSVEDTVEEAHTEITSLGVDGMGGGTGMGGMGGAGGGGGGGGVGGGSVEAVGEGDPSNPASGGSSSSAAAGGEGSEGGEGVGTGGGGGGETEVAGVVRDDGSIAVYTAPGAEEESGDYTVLITFVVVILLFLAGIFGFFKAKGGSKSG